MGRLRERAVASTAAIDALLARTLRPGAVGWPAAWGTADERVVVRRIDYHGIAGLMLGRETRLVDWPVDVIAHAWHNARSFAMWELADRALLARALEAFAKAGVEALLLKGAALAYDLYPDPSQRKRADTDLLIQSADRARARTILGALGFQRSGGDGMRDEFSFQEVWRLASPTGSVHEIDLHVRPFNSAAAGESLSFAQAASGARCLKALSPEARAPSLAFLLVHACIHRAAHRTAPYFVDGAAHYGGDRLIWLADIERLSAALGGPGWAKAVRLARSSGEAAAVSDGLRASADLLGARIPDGILDQLAVGGASGGYYSSPAFSRSLRDLRSVRGWRSRARFLGGRLFPAPSFIRSKYPRGARLPLPLLYAWRMIGLVLPRRARNRH